jgi:hypothetical protein
MLSSFAPPGSLIEEAGTMKEKRTEARFEVSLAARWQGSAANSRISDLSLGGCYMDTIVSVTVGEALSLQILMPDSSWFELQGVVAYHSPRMGFGVRFVNLDEKQRRQIRSLLMKENPRPDFGVDTSESRETLIPLEKIDLTSGVIM